MASLDDVYNKYKGQAVSVDGIPANAGQCAQWASKVMQEVYGLPIFWGNAIDYWQKPSATLKQNFDFIPYSPTMPIKKGDFVIYGPGVGSPYGHIDVAAQNGQGNNYLGYDSNWAHNLTVHSQPHNDSYNQYILGVLRRKGNNSNMSATQDAEYRQQLLTQIAKEVSVDYKDGNSVPQVIANIRQLYTLIDQKDAQIRDLQTPQDFKPYDGPQLYLKG